MKKGISLPRSMEFCHKRIIKQEEEIEYLRDRLEQEGMLAAIEISGRDKEILNMCYTCTRRGMR